MKALFLSLAVLASSITFGQNTWNASQDAKVSFTFQDDKTDGTVSGLNANIHFNTESIVRSKITATVDVASLSTNNEKRDNHLKSTDFFDVKNHPTMQFESSEFAVAGKGYTVRGNLKIKDVEREETIAFTFVETKAGGVFKGEMTIFTGNYGIKGKEGEGKTTVHIEVPVSKGYDKK